VYIDCYWRVGRSTGLSSVRTRNRPCQAVWPGEAITPLIRIWMRTQEVCKLAGGIQLLWFSLEVMTSCPSLFEVVREKGRSSDSPGIGFRVGRRAPDTDGWVAFSRQPDHSNRVFGASVDAVLLAATVIRPFQHSHLALCFEACRPADGDA
jgi:hypothetical protein